jgi:spoIIIJ-associated protein
MTGFLGKLFGKKDTVTSASNPVELIEGMLDGLFETSGLDLLHTVFADETNPEKIFVEISGNDEELLRAREGQLLDAIQLFLTRVTQHQLKDEKLFINVDNEGYREQVNKDLIDLAEKLKLIAVEKGKPVYFRALPPRDRKVIHQYLAEDGRVKSRSVGEGLFKKIKIYPTKDEVMDEDSSELATEQA